VVDFAYSASLFLGNHAVGAKVDGEIKPLSTPLVSGQVIEIITDVLATPNPDWLSFINTQKARRALQHVLKDQDIEEQRLVGAQAL
ncbi:TGS domain-containing protein, partial [Klebsiella pneumoniae]